MGKGNGRTRTSTVATTSYVGGDSRVWDSDSVADLLNETVYDDNGRKLETLGDAIEYLDEKYGEGYMSEIINTMDREQLETVLERVGFTGMASPSQGNDAILLEPMSKSELSNALYTENLGNDWDNVTYAYRTSELPKWMRESDDLDMWNAGSNEYTFISSIPSRQPANKSKLPQTGLVFVMGGNSNSSTARGYWAKGKEGEDALKRYAGLTKYVKGRRQ